MKEWPSRVELHQSLRRCIYFYLESVSQAEMDIYSVHSGLIQYLFQGGNNKRMKGELLPTVLASAVATFFAAILLSVALVGAKAAEPSADEESQTEKLAKETQNPVA